nr:MAG TPA: hypothetical protein [Caudoviricetes sp.]
MNRNSIGNCTDFHRRSIGGIWFIIDSVEK